MTVNETSKRISRYILVSIIILCLSPLCERGQKLNGASVEENIFAGKEITCAIDLGDDMKGAHGLETGLSYELLNRFAEDNDCSIRIITGGRKSDSTFLNSLEQGNIDILITHIHEGGSFEGFNVSHSINDCSAWLASDDDIRSIKQINSWLGYFTATEQYRQMRNRYTYSTNPVRRAERGVIAANVSPYDNLLKKYATELGWDWRMLAAVVYQESKFSINSRSHRGASGLMQVMPQTAGKYGITDLVNPEENLKAGTFHLARLQRQFRNKGFSQEELIKFTLAAYNAGEGRIMDCRNLAASMNIDNTKWDNIVKVIPAMREESILENENVKLGKFQGYETISYVENIMDIYQAICRIYPRA